MNTKLIINLVISVILIVYVLVNPPFFFADTVPTIFRLSIELILMLILFSFFLFGQYIQKNIIIFIGLAVVSFSIIQLMEGNNIIDHVAFFNKIIVLLLIMQVFINKPTLLNFFTRFWIRFSKAISIMTIFAFVGYILGLVDYQPYQFSELRYVLSNYFLGHISPRNYIISIPAISGYMFEPVYLGFFYGLNVVISRQLIDDCDERSRFIALNLVAGLFTFSITYYLFFGFYFLISVIRNRTYKFRMVDIGTRIIIFVSVALLLIFLFLYLDILNLSSLDQRISRMAIYQDILKNKNFLEFLLGNGVGWYKSYTNIGIDSTILAMLIERGALITVVSVILIYTITKHNVLLIMLIIIYSSVIPLNNFVLFYIMIGLQYALYKQSIIINNSFCRQYTV